MPLWRLYYHLVWATRGRELLITPEVEDELYGYIVGNAAALGGILHAVGRDEDHVHLVVSVPPRMLLAEFVKTIKGSSANHLNKMAGATGVHFGWQSGYGVFSLGAKQLEHAVRYVKSQKAHHHEGTTIPMLEQARQEDDGPPAWRER
jgi:putative transposase